MMAGIYRHYKGGLYQVLGIGQHTETDEIVVVYVALTGADLPGPRIRVRPMHGPDGFNTRVDLGDMTQERFTFVGSEIA
jgi:hypothetical protein